MSDVTPERLRAALVAVQTPAVDDAAFAASVAELGRLARTLGVDVVAAVTQRRATLHPGTVVGSGKLAELQVLAGLAADAEGEDEGGEAAALEEETPGAGGLPITAILVAHEITPSQARNLEKAPGVAVLDRTAVILEIFRRPARSRAAKAQVEIVRLSYLVPRLREQGRLKGGDRQRGGIGGKGAGESNLEMDRRKIRDRIAEPPREEPRGAGRLHERRQVDADAGADRQRGVRGRQAVRHAGHHRATAGARGEAARAGLGHRRLHRQAAPRSGGGVQER